MFSLLVETMFVLTGLERFSPFNTHPNVVLTATGAPKFLTLMLYCKWSCAMSAPIRTPTPQLLDNSRSSISLRWSYFSFIWAMGTFLITNSIPETVHEFVIGIITLGCCFDEIKELTKFDS